MLGLIGKTLGHSLSPELHKKIMEKNNINNEYILIELPEVNKDTLKNLKEMGLTGFNITIPYKQDLIPYLDYIDPKAKRIGAINTVLIKDNKFFGYNTDYYGVLKLFEDIKVKNKKCTVLGTGGGAHAVIVALMDLGASSIDVVSRNPKTSTLKQSFPNINLISYEEIKSCDIVINTTPVGMSPDINNSPIPEKIIKKFDVAVDIIYNPSRSMFLKMAQKHGLTIKNGMDMLVTQAIKAQEIWNNKEMNL